MRESYPITAPKFTFERHCSFRLCILGMQDMKILLSKCLKAEKNPNVIVHWSIHAHFPGLLRNTGTERHMNYCPAKVDPRGSHA